MIRGDGNPHVHILLTMRALDEKGKWLPKSRMVYVLEEKGEKIKLPSGNYKSRKENTVDWDNRNYAETWRHEWEKITNRYLEKNGRTERLDMRSYERQGKEEVPTVHMGGSVLGLERKGVGTFIGSLNRKVNGINERKKAIAGEIKELRAQLTDILTGKREKKDRERYENAIFTLTDYMTERQQERMDWNLGAKNKCSTKDLKEISGLIGYMQRNNIHTIKEFVGFYDRKMGEWNKVNSLLKSKERRSREIENTIGKYEVRKANKEVHEKNVKIPWSIPKNLYRKKHEEEIEAYNKAERYIRKRYPDGKIPVKSLRSELKDVVSDIEKLRNGKEEMAGEIADIRKIASIFKETRPEIYEEAVKERAKLESENAREADNKVVRQPESGKGRKPDKDSNLRPESRPSVRAKMETMKKEHDERDERRRENKVMKHDRNNPSL